MMPSMSLPSPVPCPEEDTLMDLGEDSEYTGILLPMPDKEAPEAEEIEKHNTLSQVDQEDDGINEAFRNDTVFDSELLMANI